MLLLESGQVSETSFCHVNEAAQDIVCEPQADSVLVVTNRLVYCCSAVDERAFNARIHEIVDELLDKLQQGCSAEALLMPNFAERYQQLEEEVSRQRVRGQFTCLSVV